VAAAKKVALINPGKSQRFAVQEPLNLGYIAAYLEKNGVEVKIFDQLAGDDVENAVLAFKPDVAGITSTTPVIYEAYKNADFYRKNNILTVMGGVHPWFFPHEALAHADIVVRGEGEKAMLDIVNGKRAGGVIDAGYVENVNELPFPARHLMSMGRYLYCKKYTPHILHLPYVSSRKKIIHILTSRGCPHSECIYCHNSFKKFPYRANSPEKVIEEIKLLKKDYGIDALYFVEDDFWTDIERVAGISALLIKEGLNNIVWGASARVDQIVSTPPDVFALAKKAGCRSITIGFETGSPHMLEVLKKGFTIDDACKAAENVKKAGLLLHGNIIVGAPHETMEDARLSKQFLKKTAMVTPEIYLFTPYPGSMIWCKLETEKAIPANMDWRRFSQEETIINLSAIPTKQLNKLRAAMYIAYYISNPMQAARLIFSALMHPRAIMDKILHTLKPGFINTSPLPVGERTKVRGN